MGYFMRIFERHIKLFFALLIALTGYCAAAQEHPLPLRALESQGLVVVGSMPAIGGLNAWAGYSEQHPVALFATPDGKHLIVGTMLDATGKDVSTGPLEKIAMKPINEGIWKKLENSTWIADGSPKAPRTVYVFTDPNCPYCTKFWADVRPWVMAGKIQLRHVMVGILSPTSAGKAAALLVSKAPAAALTSYEQSQVESASKTLASGRPKPLSGNTLKPLADIPPSIQTQLAENADMMAELGFRATPAIVWRDAKNAVRMRVGVPSDSFVDIFGPR